MLISPLPFPHPTDPSFWPIHPTIERLWVYKKLLGYFTGEDWPSTDLSASGDDCEGHSKDYVIEMHVLEEGKYYTNQEFYDAMNPHYDTLPYIYDNFEWPHCVDYGVDFTNMTMGVSWTVAQGDGEDSGPKGGTSAPKRSDVYRKHGLFAAQGNK